MPVEIPKDKWAGAVRTITIGATPEDGGTRSHSITVGGDLNLRVFRGLDFSVGGRVSRIKDQLYLSKVGLTPEEDLLQQRARGTEFRFQVDMGLSYRFGSKYNNIVNPRM